MKKILILLAVVFTYSCSSEESDKNDYDDADYDYSKYKYISPPTWILGTWTSENGRDIVFTKSDIIFNPNDDPYSVTKEIALYILFNDKDPKIIEKPTDNSYSLEYIIYGSEKRKINFVKLSDNEIESKGAFKGIYTKK